MIKHGAVSHSKGLSMDKFGVFVAQRRIELGISQDELGKKIDKNQTFVFRMESGKSAVDSIPLALLASALRLEVEDLLWALIDVHFLSSLRGVNLLGFLHAVGSINADTLTLDDLFALLKVESGLLKQGIRITKDMVPALLEQVQKKS